MAYRVLTVKEMPELERACPECGTIMKSSKRLFHDPTGWYVAFYCPKHEEFFPVDAPEYRDMVRDATLGVKPDALPIFGAKG